LAFVERLWRTSSLVIVLPVTVLFPIVVNFLFSAVWRHRSALAVYNAAHYCSLGTNSLPTHYQLTTSHYQLTTMPSITRCNYLLFTARNMLLYYPHDDNTIDEPSAHLYRQKISRYIHVVLFDMMDRQSYGHRP